jgi:hypothetical protein
VVELSAFTFSGSWRWSSALDNDRQELENVRSDARSGAKKAKKADADAAKKAKADADAAQRGCVLFAAFTEVDAGGIDFGDLVGCMLLCVVVVALLAAAVVAVAAPCLKRQKSRRARGVLAKRARRAAGTVVAAPKPAARHPVEAARSVVVFFNKQTHNHNHNVLKLKGQGQTFSPVRMLPESSNYATTDVGHAQGVTE